MGTFWELFQELQIRKRRGETGTLEQRMADVEDELVFIEDLLAKSLEKLEEMTCEDFGVSPDEPA